MPGKTRKNTGFAQLKGLTCPPTLSICSSSNPVPKNTRYSNTVSVVNDDIFDRLLGLVARTK